MNNAIERVNAACLQSQFKDDRHDWMLVMHETYGYLSVDKWVYELRRCKACGLSVLLNAHRGGGDYGGAPRVNDVIVHAFFVEPK